MGQCDACGAELDAGSKSCPECGADVGAAASPERAPGPPEPGEGIQAESNPYRYWAFISYSSHDKVWADWLHRSIESYGIPSRLVNHETPSGEAAPKRLRPVFRDRAELSASSDLAREIEDALAASRYLIVICSPAAALSKWVDTEIEAFQRMGRSDRILALIVDGEPHASGELECMPPALLASEPIAADARKEGDGKENARLKLLAGMLGIGFDALKQRETHRRMRRLQIGVAIASVIALGFAGIAWYAEGQRAKAVKSRQQAEGLLQYMLGDLRDGLQSIGRLDLLRGAEAHVDDYYRELGVDAGDADMVSNREAALSSKGVSLQEQGDLSGALREYRAALAISESRVSSEAGNSYALADLGAAHTKVGSVLEARGDLPGALHEYRTALDIRTALATSAASPEVWQSAVAESLTDVGGVLLDQGDVEGALRDYRTALETSERLLATGDASSTALQDNVEVGHSRLGDALVKQYDIEGALREYKLALEIAERLVSADPLNAASRSALSTAHINVGRMLQLNGDAAGALREFQAALSGSEMLVSIDPANMDWQRGLFVCRSRLGTYLMAQGDLGGARRQYEAAAASCEREASLDPSSAVAQNDLYFSHVDMGSLLFALGDLDGAIREDQAASTIMQRLVASDPGNATWQTNLQFIQETVRIVEEFQRKTAK